MITAFLYRITCSLTKKSIKHSPKPSDARSHLLSLTKKGEKELYSVFGSMSMVSQVVTGNLTAIEKTQLAFLLKKLDAHHNEIFFVKKIMNLKKQKCSRMAKND
jgi:DNA-binding MarR family transcriptional regulator